MDAATIYQQIFSTMKTGNITAILQKGYELLQLPIVVMDATCLVLEKCPHKISAGKKHWDAYEPGKQVDSTLIREAQEDGHLPVLENSEQPVFIDWGFAKKEPRYTIELRWSDKPVGYLLVLTLAKLHESWQLDTIQILAAALAPALAIRNTVLLDNATFTNTLLYGLFSGELSSKEDFDNLIASSSLDMGSCYLLVVIEPKRNGDQTLESYIVSEWRRCFTQILNYDYEDRLYILLTGLAPDCMEHEKYHKAMGVLKEIEATCGISRVFNSIYQLQDFKWQAETALYIGKHLRPKKTIHHFGDHELDSIIMSGVQNIVPQNYLHPAIFKLQDYDTQHKTEYLKTLRAYADCLFDVARTVEELHVHRNTLWYRLDKIKVLTGIDLHDSSKAIHIYLSFYYLDIQKRFGSHKPTGQKEPPEWSR